MAVKAPKVVSPFRLGHIGSTTQLASMQTLGHNAGPPASDGAFLGTVNNEPSFLNPALYHALDLTGGNSICCIGRRGKGKTTTIRKLATYESTLYHTGPDGEILPHRVVVDDTRLNRMPDDSFQAEYASLTQQLGGTHHDISKYGINLLDPRMGGSLEEQFELLVALLNHTRAVILSSTEELALMVAIDRMRAEVAHQSSAKMLRQYLATLTYNDYITYRSDEVVEVMKSIDNDAERQLLEHRFGYRDNSRSMTNFYMSRRDNTRPDEFRNACSEVANSLARLIKRNSGLFNGDHSLYEIMSQPMVGLNLTKVADDALPLLEMVLWSWRSAAINRGDLSLMADMEIHDENWSRWKSPVYAAYMIKHLKHIRGHGTRVVRAIHRPSDVKHAGKQSDQARAALNETDIVLAFQLESIEHKMFQELYGPLSHTHRRKLANLGRGHALVIIGSTETWKPYIVKVLLTARELNISQSDFSRDRLLASQR